MSLDSVLGLPGRCQIDGPILVRLDVIAPLRSQLRQQRVPIFAVLATRIAKRFIHASFAVTLQA